MIDQPTTVEDPAEQESQALEVFDRMTGELIDVRAATDEELGVFCENATELKQVVADAERVVDAELLRRLDRSGKWTRRAGDPAGGVQYEIKAPSPEAGTKGIDAAVLERELRRLVDADVIDVAAAEAAIKRTVSITMRVPWDEEVAALEDRARRDQRTLDASGNTTATAAGVKALEKMGGDAKAAVTAAEITTPAPRRKVKVTAIRKGGQG